MGNVLSLLTVVEAVFVAVTVAAFVATFVASQWSKRSKDDGLSQGNRAEGKARMTNNQTTYGPKSEVHHHYYPTNPSNTRSQPDAILDVAAETTSPLPYGSGSASQELIIMGPWGHPEEGLSFNHTGYDGIKTIKIWCGWVIDSIEVQYTRRGGELVWALKTRPHGGNLKMIDLDDGEYINEVNGYYGRLFGYGTINSLTFFTNRNKKFGPYGLKTGTLLENTEVDPIPFQVRGGKIVGFHGTFGRFMSSIGFYVSPLV